MSSTDPSLPITVHREGDPDTFRLLSSSMSNGNLRLAPWQLVTEAMEIPGRGVIVRTRLQVGLSVSTSMLFVEGVKYQPTVDGTGAEAGVLVSV